MQQNSSVEGVFAPQRSTHPFRIIENDTMSIQSMTSLGRVGRILAGTIDVTNSIADKDTQSTNASSVDCNVMTATTSNTTTTVSSMATGGGSGGSSGGGVDATMPSERNAKSTTSCNLNDSSTSSNDNTSNNAMSLQGERSWLKLKTIAWKIVLTINFFFCFALSLRTRCDCQHKAGAFKDNR